MQPTDELLNERGRTHGDFADHAGMTQHLKAVMSRGVRYQDLTPSQRESLDMIVHKIGRILSGNPDLQDHWDDIAGYARLVSQQIEQASASAPEPKPEPTYDDTFAMPHSLRMPRADSDQFDKLVQAAAGLGPHGR